MSTEQQTEAAIQAAGKTAPRLTPADIDAAIKETHFITHKHLTLCVLELRNGFFVTGESAPASAENFDLAIGAEIAHDNARKKVWALEGYQLRTKLAEREKHARRVEARQAQSRPALPIVDYTAEELKKIQADELRDQALKALDEKVADPFRAR